MIPARQRFEAGDGAILQPHDRLVQDGDLLALDGAAQCEARDPNAQHVWIYESGDRLETLRSEGEAETWLQQNDPEGVVFKCKRGPLQSTGTAAQYGVPLATE
jgi:hypothetical protein